MKGGGGTGAGGNNWMHAFLIRAGLILGWRGDGGGGKNDTKIKPFWLRERVTTFSLLRKLFDGDGV